MLHAHAKNRWGDGSAFGVGKPHQHLCPAPHRWRPAAEAGTRRGSGRAWSGGLEDCGRERARQPPGDSRSSTAAPPPGQADGWWWDGGWWTVPTACASAQTPIVNGTGNTKDGREEAHEHFP